MPIKTLFFVYLFWIKFCLSERLRDCTLVHSLSLICYLGKSQVHNCVASVEILGIQLNPQKRHTCYTIRVSDLAHGN